MSATAPSPTASTVPSWPGWIAQAEALADWMMTRYFVRKDVFGAYTASGGQITASLPTLEIVRAHCRGKTTIGAHTISTDNRCLQVTIDIDAHDEQADPAANWSLTLGIVAKARADFDLKAVVFDSNGKGGYHVTIYFKSPVASDVAYWLCRQLVSIHRDHGFDKPPEHFPKQPRVKPDAPFGNWSRLPGRHHKRPHWTRLYLPDLDEWQVDGQAAKTLIGIRGNLTDRLLDAYRAAHAEAEEERDGPSPGPSGNGKAPPHRDKADEETVRSALAYLPDDWADSYGGTRYDSGWLGIGMALHDWDQSRGLALWEEFSARCPTKYDPGVCREKWATFSAGSGLTLGTIFKEAESRGWVSPWEKARRERAAAEAKIHETNGPRVEPWPKGTPVRCLDRGNHGTVEEDHGGDHLKIRHDGAHGTAYVVHPRSGLVRLDGEGNGTDAAADLPPPKLLKPSDLYRDHPRLREPIIEGLLRRTETMNVVAPSKTGKSWLSLGLALCIATARPWLGRFPVKRGRVLLIDNELHVETIASRLKWVAESMGLGVEEYNEHLCIESLRGQLRSLADMGPYFGSIVGQFDVTILDAGYRFTSPGEDENSNAVMTMRYNLLDSYANLTGSAYVYVHHSSKGDQTGKATVDVGAGAGAQARAVDCHLVLVSDPMLETGRLAVDAAVRSFPPLDSFTIRREGPIWVEDGAPPPKPDKAAAKQKTQDEATRQLIENDAVDVADHLRKRGPATARAIRDAMGWGQTRADRAIYRAEHHAWIKPAEIEVKRGKATSTEHGYQACDWETRGGV